MILGPYWCQQENAWLRFHTNEHQLLSVERSVVLPDAPDLCGHWESILLDGTSKMWTVQGKEESFDTDDVILSFATNETGQLFKTAWQIRNMKFLSLLNVFQLSGNQFMLASRHPFVITVDGQQHDMQKDASIQVISPEHLPLTPEAQQQRAEAMRQQELAENNELLEQIKSNFSSPADDIFTFFSEQDRAELLGRFKQCIDNGLPLPEAWNKDAIEASVQQHVLALSVKAHPVCIEINKMCSETHTFRDLQLPADQVPVMMKTLFDCFTNFIRARMIALATAYHINIPFFEQIAFASATPQPAHSSSSASYIPSPLIERQDSDADDLFFFETSDTREGRSVSACLGSVGRGSRDVAVYEPQSGAAPPKNTFLRQLSDTPSGRSSSEEGDGYWFGAGARSDGRSTPVLTFDDDYDVISKISNAVKRAQTEYARWYNLPLFSREKIRGNHGFFSKQLRHTQRGQRFAQAFARDIDRMYSSDAINNRINAFLTDPRTHFNKHSFSNFLLAELAQIEGSQWAGLPCDTNGKFHKRAISTALSPIALREQQAPSPKLGYFEL